MATQARNAAERVEGLTESEVAALTLRCGRERVTVGDLFDVSGEGVQHVAFAGDLRRVDGIGSGMSRGRVIVRGRYAPIVGRVSMDITAIDVTDVSGVEVGDEVVLIGSSGELSITAAEQYFSRESLIARSPLSYGISPVNS